LSPFGLWFVKKPELLDRIRQNNREKGTRRADVCTPKRIRGLEVAQ